MYKCMFLFTVSFTLKIAAENRVDSRQMLINILILRKNTSRIVHWSVFTATVITQAKQLLKMNC